MVKVLILRSASIMLTRIFILFICMLLSACLDYKPFQTMTIFRGVFWAQFQWGWHAMPVAPRCQSNLRENYRNISTDVPHNGKYNLQSGTIQQENLVSRFCSLLEGKIREIVHRCLLLKYLPKKYTWNKIASVIAKEYHSFSFTEGFISFLLHHSRVHNVFPPQVNIGKEWGNKPMPSTTKT